MLCSNTYLLLIVKKTIREEAEEVLLTITIRTGLVSVVCRACVVYVFSSSDEKVPDSIKYAYHAL